MDTQKLKKKCTMAAGFSGARLALNYYMLEEGLTEEEQLPEAFYQYMDILRTSLSRYLDGDMPAAETTALREQVIHEMKVVSAYTDCFLLYEYVLNRMERRFRTNLPVIPESGIIGELMSFVSNSKDAVVMNGRIQRIIGQLPVRFTRKKFYAMVKEALTVYLGTDRESFNNLLYMLGSSAMTDLPAGMDAGYEDLYAVLDRFRTMDFKQMDADQYGSAESCLTSVSEQLNRYSSWYLTLQEVINDFHVLILAGERAMVDVAEMGIVRHIIATLLKAAERRAKRLPNDILLPLLEDLEGMQELYYEKYQRAAAAEPSDDEQRSAEAQLGRKLDLLLSGSAFVALDESKSCVGMVDTAWLDEQTEFLFEKLDKQFAASQKQIGRAMMAAVLSQLPICFNQLDEFELYINGSLSSCADHAEKETCIELLRKLMESEYALV